MNISIKLKKHFCRRIAILLFPLAFASHVNAQPALDQAFQNYSPQGAAAFSAEKGKELWNVKTKAEDGKDRDCAACHGKNLTQSGKHIETGKVIEPMAPSVNKERFTDLAKIEKWFKRNCKWTIGRECTSEEKGHFLKYLSTL